MRYFFRLNNLTNDKEICILQQLTSESVDLACSLQNIGIEDLGVEIVPESEMVEVIE